MESSSWGYRTRLLPSPAYLSLWAVDCAWNLTKNRRQENRSFYQMGNSITTSSPICFSTRLLCLPGCCMVSFLLLRRLTHTCSGSHAISTTQGVVSLFSFPLQHLPLLSFSTGHCTWHSEKTVAFLIKTKNKLPISDVTPPTTLLPIHIPSQIYGRSWCLHFVTIHS